MSRWQTLKKVLTDRDYRMIRLAKAGAFNFMSDRNYIMTQYQVRMQRKLNLDDPQLFSEKLQWLKLNDHNPLYTQLVDKYRVREYIAEKVGQEYLIPLLGVWDDPDEIDFDALPDQFVLKCNHNSGTGMYICRDKSQLDQDAVRKNLRKGMRENFYKRCREWPYKGVTRKIIAEKLMAQSTDTRFEKGLDDYRFYCFHGEPRLIYVYQSSGLKYDNKPGIASCDIFDTHWERMPFRQKSPNAPVSPLPPANLDKMLEISRCLSQEKIFMRVDFYEVDGQLYVGELTLYPGGGFAPFYPAEWDQTIGTWLNLP